jgi:O-acetylhomoserine/O-acetylserine sulfhydrylase-like pyridoxal-dependent enzyme
LTQGRNPGTRQPAHAPRSRLPDNLLYIRETEHAGNLSALKEFGNIYTRLMNSATDVFEKRLAGIEGGTAAVAVASGEAAETFTLLAVIQIGDKIANNQRMHIETNDTSKKRRRPC